jgi:hypothetical protein
VLAEAWDASLLLLGVEVEAGGRACLKAAAHWTARVPAAQISDACCSAVRRDGNILRPDQIVERFVSASGGLNEL